MFRGSQATLIYFQTVVGPRIGATDQIQAQTCVYSTESVGEWFLTQDTSQQQQLLNLLQSSLALDEQQDTMQHSDL